MREAAHYLIGKHDFSSFCEGASPTELSELRIETSAHSNGTETRLLFRAPQFCAGQIRRIVGLLERIGAGTCPPETMREVLARKNIAADAPLAPPRGLYLDDIRYSDAIMHSAHLPLEPIRHLASGIGAVNVHWTRGGAQPPFGRPVGYENNLCKWGMVESASELILLGDGHSNIGGWPNDEWWIWKELGNANSAGYNSFIQNDPGAMRHGGRSNYVFGDGRAETLDPNLIPCDESACWWSAPQSPH
jgi:prepilin-type processing-associated H-X9-DG protein